RHVDAAVARGAVYRRCRRPGAVRVENGDEPEDAEVLHPRRALDERTQVEAVVTGIERSLDRELEPGDLPRADVGRGLDRDAVVARPSRRWRAIRTVTAERARAVLPRLVVPRPEIGDLAEPSAHPAGRAAVVVRDRRGRAITRAERGIAALSVPLRVEPRDARRQARGGRDAWSLALHARGRGHGRARGMRRWRSEGQRA